MCTLTKECFKHLALKNYQNKDISNSQKLNLFAKEYGYKSYNAILKTLCNNEPSFDLKLLFPHSKPKEDLDYIKKAEIYGFHDRFYSAQIDSDFFDEIIDFSFSEQDGLLYGKSFATEGFLFTAKTIDFAIPGNMSATFSCQSFNYHGLLRKEVGTPKEEVDSFVETALEKMILNGKNCFTIGASSTIANALHYQYKKNITSIKNIEDAKNISFYVLNNIEFIEHENKNFLMESFEVVIYAFINYYMMSDYFVSTSLAIEIPFSKKNMTKEQFDMVQVLKEVILQSCEVFGRVFTKPVHLDYSDFDKEKENSYLFFTRKDIPGKISNMLRDDMMYFEL
ncbi:hypothetical protein [Sulfurimonas indica]|nr:hypothetical protein [Sulfurimonas indica]